MINTFNKILDWLLYQGIHEGLTETKIQDVKFINREALAFFFVTLPCVPLCYIAMPYNKNYLILLLMSCFYFLPFFLNKFSLYSYAKTSILLVASTAIFWSSGTFGKESDLHYVFIILVFATILNFQRNEKKHLFFIFLITTIFLVVLFLTDFTIFYNQKLTTLQINLAQYASVYTCLAGSIIMAFFYINKFTKQRQQIKEYNEVLEKKYAELQKLNAELDRFVYSVSHDLRAPITSVLGLTYLGKRTSNVEEMHQYLDLQEKSLKKLDNFISDILNYARNSRMELHVQEINFGTEFENIVELQTQYDPNQHIQTQVAVSQNYLFFTDKQRLMIVLNNLIGNAFRYYNPYQTSPFIHLSVEVFPQKAIIKVQDNGIGIGKEHLDKIFEMFYRATDKTTGSGLGLYIAKEVVEKLKGKISVSSELGKGTTFKIEIPNLNLDE
ncbi:MAG: HAMP domain-containing histidine kinase [Thermoflexibacter sp.]|nr:HAMP domain-containing histidine kinase [Thermoflexibacter sp.]